MEFLIRNLSVTFFMAHSVHILVVNHWISDVFRNFVVFMVKRILLYFMIILQAYDL